MQRRKKGFTLIELLVVVLIIGILSAAALPQYQKAVEKSRMSEALNMMASLRPAVEVFVLANGYPANKSLLGAAAGGELDIDLKNALDCSTEENACSSKNFKYAVQCARGQCHITATRNTSPGFSYQLWNSLSEDKWSYRCRENTGWEYICAALAPLGYEETAY